LILIVQGVGEMTIKNKIISEFVEKLNARTDIPEEISKDIESMLLDDTFLEETYRSLISRGSDHAD